MSNRYKGTIDLQKLTLPSDKPMGRVAGMIVGKGASNLKRLTSAVPGSFIKVFSGAEGEGTRVALSECDKVTIMANDSEDVGKLAKMIKQDIDAFLDPTKECSRPKEFVECTTEVAAIVIGRGGFALKEFVNESAPGCFVVHSRPQGGFVITGNSLDSVTKAKDSLVEKTTKVYYRLQKREETTVTEVGLDWVGDIVPPPPVQIVDLSDMMV
jgi:hypothetical protein